MVATVVLLAAVLTAEPTRSPLETGLASVRSLAEESRWGEAVAALEATQPAAAKDVDVLIALGWSAFQAGDLTKAKSALERASHAARDPISKAAALSCLGHIDEAYGRRDQAASRYRAALALHRNPAIVERLRSLPSELAEPISVQRSRSFGRCAEPRTLEKLCRCLNGVDAISHESTVLACAQEGPPPLPSTQVLMVRGEDYARDLVLIEEGDNGWSVLTKLDEAGTSSRTYFEPTQAATSIIAGKQVVRLTTTLVEHHENWFGGYTAERKTETICVADVPGGHLRCLLSVPVLDEYHFYDLVEDGDGRTKRDNPDPRLNWGKKLRVDIGQDGLAQVVLVTGTTDDFRSLLGIHRLW